MTGNYAYQKLKIKELLYRLGYIHGYTSGKNVAFINEAWVKLHREEYLFVMKSREVYCWRWFAHAGLKLIGHFSYKQLEEILNFVEAKMTPTPINHKHPYLKTSDYWKGKKGNEWME
jgi:hypothetical protein